MDEVLQELQWKKFEVGSGGFVCLVDVMGSDESIVQAARVSYGKGRGTCPSCFTKWNKPFGDCQNPWHGEQQKKDETLVRYLMRHQHGTPFEMAEVKLMVRVPMDTWRQWIRHRTANVNEYSTRYTTAIDVAATTDPAQWRIQSATNKQGSGEFLAVELGDQLSMEEHAFLQKAQDLYKARLSYGVAREQARKDLPLSTYTEAYWKCDLRNIFNFLRLRMDSHAQLEIRQYATTIGEQIIKPLFPIAYSAFEDYMLNSISLSNLEVNCIAMRSFSKMTNLREVQEFVSKLKVLNFYYEEWEGWDKWQEKVKSL